jgi:hypothetical protein
MLHSTYVLMYGLSMIDQKKDGFLRLIVFTIVKIASTNKEKIILVPASVAMLFCWLIFGIYVGTKMPKFPLPVMGMPVRILGSVRVLTFYLDPLPELY